VFSPGLGSGRPRVPAGGRSRAVLDTQSRRRAYAAVDMRHPSTPVRPDNGTRCRGDGSNQWPASRTGGEHHTRAPVTEPVEPTRRAGRPTGLR
jgi:hypothetical protein